MCCLKRAMSKYLKAREKFTLNQMRCCTQIIINHNGRNGLLERSLYLILSARVCVCVSV